MTTRAISRREDGTIVLDLTIPWTNVSSVYEEVIADLVKNAELPGFRKGKAPRAMVEEKLDRSAVYEDVIRKLLPKVYNEAVTEEKLKPIISPKVELKEAKENADWVITIYTCEKPKLTLGDYKKAVAEKKADRHKKIWVPGKDQKPEEEKEDKKPRIEEVLSWVAETVTITIPELLLEQEVNRLLSNLIDQTKSLGLSVEQYLTATGRNAESVRKEYEAQARQTITLEFALEDIADKEGILISDDDIDAVIKSAKTEEEKKKLSQDRYYIASILRRQKTIDFLANL
jgi:FKBP-type peptidyl-prolyl cis-trans isomerase (trigger factor)